MPSRRIVVPMRARDTAESHRVSTPLELLFDLTFVVAISQVAGQLAERVAEGRPGGAVAGFLMVFFAIWWAWMNFTWFASAYDTDDVPYRLLTLLQMAGVLVLAAGVPAAFSEQDFVAITLGYVIMRIALTGQWLRAGLADQADQGGRKVALRYVAGVALVQVLWLIRLTLPTDLAIASFVLLAGAELLVPLVAERNIGTSWHPHHIAERYGLFTIIVLGECVSAAALAIQSSVVTGGWSVDVVVTFAGSLLLPFALWWIYYLKPAGAGLERRRGWSFAWGYGHYGIFAALAALGAGLEVAAEATSHHLEASATLVAFAVALPVGVFLLLVWGLHVPLSAARPRDLWLTLLTVAGIEVLAALTSVGLPTSWAVLLMAVPPAGIVLSATLRAVTEPEPAG